MKFYRDGLDENIDSVPKRILTSDGHVVECYSINGINRYFATLAGSHYCAHGGTIAEAIADALWKDEKKRPSAAALKQSICADGKDRKITLQEFRLLTGACLVGCREALEKAGLDGSPMIADDIEKYFPEWGRKLKMILEWCEYGN